VQLEYSPFALDIEHPIPPSTSALLSTCRELRIAIVAYSPLGRGFLTGMYKGPEDFEEGDFRKHSPRYSKENFGKNLELVDRLGEWAVKKGCTKGQLTLAWLLSQGDDILPIP
jgi:aryl-alcohol dehydrogenase-like predicted oxidoreductase